MLFIIIIIIILIFFFKKKKTIQINNIITCNNDIYILNNFYQKKTFNFIKKYCKLLKFKDDIRINSRKTICLKKLDHINLYNKIYNNELKLFIKKIINRDFIIPSYPIEYRIYPKKSIGMKMHKDTPIYDNQYFEAVLTIVNKSNSKFKYICNKNLKSIYPKENTLVLVKPNSILHGVTSTNNGYRTILKFVIIFKNNKNNNNFRYNYDLCPF